MYKCMAYIWDYCSHNHMQQIITDYARALVLNSIPCSPHFACLPYLTHLIDMISPLVQFIPMCKISTLSALNSIEIY